jgi:F-type H+-transporting ATPase subunit gamma
VDSLERLNARLDNIEAVQPLLNAMRAISLSSRLLALNKARAAEAYHQDLQTILTLLLPRVPRSQRSPHLASHTSIAYVLLVVGTERGLCGAFNETIAAFADQVLTRHTAAGQEVRLMTLGTRIRSTLERWGRTGVWSGNLSATALPSYALAQQLATTWLADFRTRSISGVEVAYNAYRGLARYEPRCQQLLPPPQRPEKHAQLLWPPTIETDARQLLSRVAELWLSATLYGILLESAAAEHSARFQLLDGASQNADRLVEELKLFLQTARQEAITSELQDLAVGSGLLQPRRN